MSAFDTVKVVKLEHDEFEYNGESFQTQCLECNGSDFIIFNNQIWLDYDGDKGVRLSKAEPLDISDEVTIYASCNRLQKTLWIEYRLTFEDGQLVTLEKLREDVTQDLTDLSKLRPSPLTSSACVTIDFRGVDGDSYQEFTGNLDDNLDKIREVICDPMAEIVYQVRPSGTHLFSSYSPRWIHSVVQSFGKMESAGKGVKKAYAEQEKLKDNIQDC